MALSNLALQRLPSVTHPKYAVTVRSMGHAWDELSAAANEQRQKGQRRLVLL